MMLFKTDPRFDNSALTLNLQTETNTPPVHCAVTLKDPFSTLAGKGISKCRCLVNHAVVGDIERRV